MPTHAHGCRSWWFCCCLALLSACGGDDDGNAPADLPCGGEQAPQDRRIATESGTVVGVIDGETDAYLGVPFVAPPVGALRWAAPEPFGCFDGEFSADTFGPRCPQLDADETTVIGDEDCLHLNLWTPTTRASDVRLPVMFFLHGGGNAVGSAVDPLYDGRGLAARDVVVVTANYRLGALGYLLDDQVPTNLGTRDQLAALGWIKRNIAAFGGDPDNVTVFGESAGAVNTCTLLGVPSASGLLHKAIVQSGACTHRTSTAYRQQMGAFVDNTGCAGSSDVLSCLRGLDAASIVTTEPTGFPSVAGLGQAWGPHIDGELLPNSTIAQMEAGTSLRVPWMIGSNLDETANGVPQGMTRMQFENLVRVSFAGRGIQLPAQILAQYPASDFPDGTEAWIRLTTEAKFQCFARRSARIAAASGVDTYLYMFAYDGYTARVRQARAIHGIELPFIFDTFAAIELGIGGLTYTPNATDLQMRDEMQARWISFARDGAPNEPTTPAWPQSPDAFLVLDVPARTGTDEYPQARCDFWEGLLDSLP